ncbi:hypothetical protein [Atlantibacter sp.]|uniref:hypothetical protein n=1 Tax=Atlantibacter sp. TaxID=1903473 RepID=UPI0013EF8FE8|nr:hypothetical protein [Atlantibacter sp.]
MSNTETAAHQVIAETSHSLPFKVFVGQFGIRTGKVAFHLEAVFATAAKITCHTALKVESHHKSAFLYGVINKGLASQYWRGFAWGLLLKWWTFC